MAMPTTPRLFDALRHLTSEVQAEKQAAANGHVKQADGPVPKDPGGYAGPSTHPSAKTDNNAQDAQTGARAAEYEKDIKDQIGAPSVNSAPEPSPTADMQSKVQLNINSEHTATGDDPSVEDDYKGNLEDPGTTHPAKATIGEKYGSASFVEAHRQAITVSNEILADLANGFGQALQKQAAAPVGAVPTSVATGDAAPTASAAFDAGYEYAAILGLTKQAAVGVVSTTLEQTMLDAERAASLTADCLHKAAAHMKHAGKDSAEGEDHNRPGDDSSGGNTASAVGAASKDAGGGGAPGGGSHDGSHSGPGGSGGLADLLSGGGSAPSGPPPGADPTGGMGGGMGGGMPPGDPMGGGPGGQPSEQEALQELVMALEELGIPIEALAQAKGAGAGPGAAPAPGAGGDPGLGEKLASAVISFKRSGKFQLGLPMTKRSRHLRDEMKNHVRELMGLA